MKKMYKTLIIIILLIFFCEGNDKFEKQMNIISRKKSRPTKLTMPTKLSNRNYNNTCFCPIPLFYDKQDKNRITATIAEEHEFSWIARVFHSQTKFTPFLCTAAVIQAKVFITAGACLATAKVTYTTVEYKKTRLRTKAIVLPRKRSMQMFDDIGFIVVKDSPASLEWSSIALYGDLGHKRTDENFEWLEDWDLGQAPKSSVVGFLVQETSPDEQRLYKVEEGMYVSTYLCNQLIPANNNTGEYIVPCYHYCSVQDYKDGHFKRKYLLGLGHVLYSEAMSDVPYTVLIGIATWACDAGIDSYLPVGIAIPNSNAYYDDFNCALKIRDDDGKSVNGHYQYLCDTLPSEEENP